MYLVNFNELKHKKHVEHMRTQKHTSDGTMNENGCKQRQQITGKHAR